MKKKKMKKRKTTQEKKVRVCVTRREDPRIYHHHRRRRRNVHNKATFSDTITHTLIDVSLQHSQRLAVLARAFDFITALCF